MDFSSFHLYSMETVELGDEGIRIGFHVLVVNIAILKTSTLPHSIVEGSFVGTCARHDAAF